MKFAFVLFILNVFLCCGRLFADMSDVYNKLPFAGSDIKLPDIVKNKARDLMKDDPKCSGIGVITGILKKDANKKYSFTKVELISGPGMEITGKEKINLCFVFYTPSFDPADGSLVVSVNYGSAEYIKPKDLWTDKVTIVYYGLRKGGLKELSVKSGYGDPSDKYNRFSTREVYTSILSFYRDYYIVGS